MLLHDVYRSANCLQRGYYQQSENHRKHKELKFYAIPTKVILFLSFQILKQANLIKSGHAGFSINPFLNCSAIDGDSR